MAEKTDQPQEPTNVEPIKCPKCQELLPDYPNLWRNLHPVRAMNALSRRDNKTYICSICGEVEALHDWSKEPETALLRRYYGLDLVGVVKSKKII